MADTRASTPTETLAALRRDPIVIGMAGGLRETPITELAHENGTPRHEFMLAALDTYRKRGGQYTGRLRIGTIASALLSLLETPNTPEELYHGIPDDGLQMMVNRLEQRMAKEDAAPALGAIRAEVLGELERRRNA